MVLQKIQTYGGMKTAKHGQVTIKDFFLSYTVVTESLVITPHWREHSIVPSFWKKFWQFLIQLNKLLLYDPAVPLLSIA